MAFSRYDAALAWARRAAVEAWGAIAVESPVFDFAETEYYTASMGSGLRKVLWAFEDRMNPAELVAHKRQTNAWEAAYAKIADGPEPRPLNLDAGYLTPDKLVLASTRDRARRIYLDRGIYAEVFLTYRGGDWLPTASTYPDYRRADYHAFFSRCREWMLRGAEGGPP